MFRLTPFVGSEISPPAAGREGRVPQGVRHNEGGGGGEGICGGHGDGGLWSHRTHPGFLLSPHHRRGGEGVRAWTHQPRVLGSGWGGST